MNASPPTIDRYDRDSVEVLLQKVATGDQQAFAHLYELMWSPTLVTAIKVLRDHHQAEEVAQEALLQIWQLARRFDPLRGSARNWMLNIARSRAVDRVRHCAASRVRDQHHIDSDQNRDVDQVIESVLRNVDAGIIRAGMLELTPVQREAIDLAFFSGLTYPEIAAQLTIPLGTVKTRIRNGMFRMRQALERPVPSEVAA